VDDRPLADNEVVMYCLSLLVAGNETTRHLLSGSVLALFEHPQQRARLAEELRREDGPTSIETAVEECLRWTTPIQAFARTATTDVTIRDTAISQGDWVVMLYASANRDEEVFGTDSESFDVTRPVNPTHVAFGFGEHLCLGASLARLEARTFLDELLRRFPDYEVVGPPEWTTSTLVRGMTSLPVVLT
jgi:cytochrome P450